MTVDGPDAECYQWRLQAATDRVQLRRWDVPDSGSVVPSEWTTIPTGIVDDTASPFTAVDPTDRTHQALEVALVSKAGTRDSATTESHVRFTARDSPATAPADPVCPEAGQP